MMNTYCTMNYLSRERWISFWYQMMEVNRFSPISVLEIGVGTRIVSETLKSMGKNITTLDIDSALQPTIKGDTVALPFKKRAFDVVLVAEVLEHIPFVSVSQALREIARVAKFGVVITLPHFHQFAPSIALKVFPFVPRFRKVFPITFPTEHKFDGQHYWEIGKRGYPLEKIKNTIINSTRMNMTREYLIEENPYHHMFVLNVV